MCETKCTRCGHIFKSEEPRISCPDCGSDRRTIAARLMERLTLYDGLGHRIRDKNLSGKKKYREEGFQRYERSKVGRRLVFHQRHIDRRHDVYHEVVKCPKTGELIYSTTEPLSTHQGHGSAKLRS